MVLRVFDEMRNLLPGASEDHHKENLAAKARDSAHGQDALRSFPAISSKGKGGYVRCGLPMMLASCSYCPRLKSYKNGQSDLYRLGLLPHKCPSCGALNKSFVQKISIFQQKYKGENHDSAS